MQDLIGRNYDVILADPPWRYNFSKSNSRKIENHYPTMTSREIMDLPVGQIAAKQAVLYLWATNPKLVEALEVMKAWGFQYRTAAVWDKERIGMGYYFQSQHELLLVGKRGRFPTPPPETRRPSVIRASRRKHSAKPVEVHQRLENMYPQARKVELFARSCRKAWDVWGNEV